MLYVYRYLNNVTKTYSAFVFAEAEPESHFRKTHEAVLLHPDRLVDADLHCCTIEYLGTYDQSKGVIVPADDDKTFDIQAEFKMRSLMEDQMNGKC